MSGNSAKVSEKSWKKAQVRERSGEGRGICIVREI